DCTSTVQTKIGGNLIIARPSGVELAAHGSDDLGQACFDIHVHVFAHRIPNELSSLNLPGDLVESGDDALRFLLRDDAGTRQAASVRLRTFDVDLPQGRIHCNARIELLHGIIDGLREATSASDTHARGLPGISPSEQPERLRRLFAGYFSW